MANQSLIVAGSRITAGVVASIAPNAVIKGADESVLNSSTLQNDDALFVTVVANATYLFDCYLDFEGAAQGTGDLKWGWTVPSGGSLRYHAIYTDTLGNNGTGTTLVGASTAAAGTATAGNLRGLSMRGSLFTSSAGTLQLRWAQNTPNNTTATTVHAQSYLSTIRIS